MILAKLAIYTSRILTTFGNRNAEWLHGLFCWQIATIY